LYLDNGIGFAFIALGGLADARARNGAPNEFMAEPQWLGWIFGSIVESSAQGAAGLLLEGIHHLGSHR
jgi:hypothetical protein